MTTKCEQQPQDQQETYTPEEVQRDLDIVAEVLVAYVARSDVSSPSRAALSRLAAQAARVPGLEADLANAREDVATNQRVIAEEVEKRMHAQSERDAARKEAASAFACCGGNDAPEGKREHTQDCNRREAEGLRLGQENASLRERVATLEARADERREHLLNVEDAKRTAEARVRELEEDRAVALQALADLGAPEHSGDDEVPPGVALSLAERIRRLASHPAPSTGADTKTREALGCIENALLAVSNGLVSSRLKASYAKDARQALRSLFPGVEPISPALAGRTEPAPSPTPPPGLLEAVGRVVEAVNELRRWNDNSNEREGFVFGGIQPWAKLQRAAAHLQTLTTFDAAKGGEHPDSVAARANFNDLRRALEMATLGSHVGDTETAMGEKTVQAVRKLHEDAAKYRAAVERLDDRSGKAKAAHDAWGSDPEGAVARWVLYGDGAAPAPRETLDKARVVEVLESHLGPHVVNAILRDLGLTLVTPPSGPGGGERKTTRINLTPEKTQAVNALLDTIAPTSHARIAPTPTPDVPPIERVSPQAHGGHMGPKAVHEAIAYAPPPMQRDASRALSSLAADYTNLRTTCAAESLARDISQPQPSTPDVVWEGDGLTVKADGTVWDSHEHRATWQVVGILARALAEAKRETAHAQGLLDVAAPALSQAVRQAAQLGAEEMREQAQELLRSLAGDENITATGKMWLVRAEGDVRALPLLGKAVRRG